MTAFLSASQAARLRKIARRYQKKVKLGKPWNNRSEDELWRKVLSQIVVVGRAEPGYELEHNPKVGKRVAIKKLMRFRNDTELQKYLHEFLLSIETRFVSKKQGWRNDKKARAGGHNFKVLTEAGGPKKFFEKVANLPTESQRIQFLEDSFEYYAEKGARDTLIELGLAENCMALDVRIYGVLEKVGVRVSPDDIYSQIEKELIEKVARPLGISGGRLDRILFQNYSEIIQES